LVYERSVLIVDRSEETREVLSTALGRRGVRTYYASRPKWGLKLAQRLRPDLVVLDLEIDNSGPETICAPFAEQSRASQTPMILLGSARRQPGRSTDEEFVLKPYHYGPLIRRIEELLGRRQQAVAESA